MTLTDAQARILQAMQKGERLQTFESEWSASARVALLGYERVFYADVVTLAREGLIVRGGHHIYALTPAGAEALARHEEGEG